METAATGTSWVQLWLLFLSVLRYCDSINDGTQLNKCATAAVLEQRGLGRDHVVPLKWVWGLK